jgi:hypothetical protein
MKRKGVHFILHYWIVLIAVLLCSVGSATADYCSSNGNSVSWEWIGSITVEDFSRSSGSNGGYADYTGDIIQLAPGANSVVLVPGFRSSSYTESWCLWIDLNHDEVFSSDERLYAGASNAAITTEIQVPGSALSGQTRMRISMRYGSLPSACGSFTYGEVEDYTVDIAGDPTGPPVVLTTAPVSGAVDVSIDTFISATFNKSLDPASITSANFQVSVGGNAVAGALVCNGAIATFTPSAPLLYETAYDVTLTTGIKDIEGTPLDEAVTWSFTTEPVPDTLPPEVIATDPPAGATDVAVNSQILITFSERMDPYSINASTINLSTAGGTVPGAVACNGMNATFTPSAILPFDREFTVTVSTGATDLAGNALPAEYAFTFTTIPAGPGDVIEQELLGTDSIASDYFGCAVAVSGNIAVIGANGDDDNGSYSGSAYIFLKDGTYWVPLEKITASDGAAYDAFGYSVAVDSNIIVVGAYYDGDAGAGTGSAYIFENIDGQWVETAKLTASDGAAYDYFGYAVACAGTQVLIGAYGDDDNGSYSGSAYVFEKIDGAWIQTAKIVPDDGIASANFGRAVSISSNSALIGAYADKVNNTYSGSAYLYEKVDGTWTFAHKFSPDGGMAYDYFGNAVAVSGGNVLIGAYGDDNLGTSAGIAYLFEKNGGAWQAAGTLTAPDGAAYDYFGKTVALDGNRAVVGAYGDDDLGSYSGSAYLFEKTDGVWQMSEKLVAFDGGPSASFGDAVDINGSQVVVGAKSHYVNSVRTGAAYLFSLPDNMPPQVSDVSPENGAMNVAVNESITAIFSENMAPESFDGNTFLVSDGSANISGSISVNGASVVFTPDADLLADTVYTVTIGTGAMDLAGNPLADNYVWTFTTGQNLDIDPPEITGHSPLADELDVPVNSSITVVFSEPIDAATVTSSTFLLSDGVDNIQGTISASGQTATFTPTASMQWETGYTATVTSGVQDLSGNALTADYTWSFTTGAAPDTIAPEITSVMPANNAADVSPDTVVDISFSEEMDPASITTASVIVSLNGSAIAGTVEYQSGHATFTPTDPLAYSAVYTITVTADAEDLAGNGLEIPFESVFTTMDEPVIYSMTLYPATAAHGLDGGEANGWTVDGVIDSITLRTDYDQPVVVSRYRSLDFTKYSELRGLYEFNFGAVLPQNSTIVSATLVLDTESTPSGERNVTVKGYAGDGQAQISDFDLGTSISTVLVGDDDLVCDVTSYLASISATDNYIGFILTASPYYGYTSYNYASFWNGTPHPVYGHISGENARLIVEYSPE